MAEQLLDLNIQTTLNSNGHGLCRVTARGDDVVLEGQIPPDMARRTAMAWMEAAEAADLEALVFDLVSDNVDRNAALGFLAALRDRRGDSHQVIKTEMDAGDDAG